jgi:hypothetical protein
MEGCVMRTKRRAICAAVVTALALVAVPAGAADEPPSLWNDCGLLGLDPQGVPTCLDGESPPNLPATSAGEAGGTGGLRSFRSNCRIRAEAFFWTGTDWLRLAQALAADRSPCAEYWVSIPPLAADKRGLRVLQDDLVRALGIHPVAEMTLGEVTGWANWIKNNNKTWFEAGVEFRRRMAAAGYDVTAGETWMINELDRSTQRDAPREAIDHPVPPYLRQHIRDLMRGLYFGEIGMPPSTGVVEVGINFRHQNLPDVPQYKAEVQRWLEDAPFWEDVDRYARWLAFEALPDVRHWGVPGTSRDQRRRKLEEYLFHPLDLVRSGPASVAAARKVFERAYLPLGNSIWRARGGEQFQFVTGAGNTIVDAETMKHFVSEQVYAIRHYTGAHPQGAPAGRLGFAWQPCNRLSAAEPGCRALDAEFLAGLNGITARIASAVHYSFREGGASPAGACAPPASAADWCEGQVPGAVFTDAWSIFDRWD